MDHVDRNLENLGKLGISVIRWHVLGNGNSYGPAPVKHITLTFDVDWSFDPPLTVDKRFRRDFEELLNHFKNVQQTLRNSLKDPNLKLQLMPILIDYQFGARYYPLAGNGPLPGVGHGGRSDVIRDPHKRKQFLDTVLAELLAACSEFKEQIFAWDVINEPVWLCRGFGPLSSPLWNPRVPEVSPPQMTDFLTDAIKRISKARMDSTVGHRYYADLARFPTGSIPQFHYYAENHWYKPQYNDPAGIDGKKLFDPVKITGIPEFGDRRVKPILGEFDSDFNPHGEPWPDLHGKKDSTYERLALLSQEGCDLSLIWPDLSDKLTIVVKGDVIKLREETRKMIRRYTKGTLPPPNE